MTPEQIFSLLNMTALAAWVLLALLPRRRLVVDVVVGTTVPILLAVVYTAIVATAWRGSDGGFSSLAAVATL